MSHNEGGSQTGCAWLRLQSSIYMAESMNKDGIFHLPPLMPLKREKKKVGGGCICLVSAWPLLHAAFLTQELSFLYLLPFLFILCGMATCDFRLLALLCQNKMQSAASPAVGQRSLRYETPLLNAHAIMRRRDARCLRGEGVALQVLALPAWLASLSVSGG